MLQIVQIGIPIPDYYEEEVFHQRFLFDSSPTYAMMEKFLADKDFYERKRIYEYPEYVYDDCYHKCLKAIRQVTVEKEWAMLPIPSFEGSLVQSCIQGIRVYLRGETKISYIDFQIINVYQLQTMGEYVESNVSTRD